MILEARRERLLWLLDLAGSCLCSRFVNLLLLQVFQYLEVVLLGG